MSITTHLTPESITAFLLAVGLSLVISVFTIRKAKMTQFTRGASSRCGEIEALILEKSQLRELVDQLNEQNAKFGTDLVQVNTRAEQLPILETEVDRLRSSLADARGECIRLSTQISEQQAQNEEKLQILNEAKSQLKDQFKALANEILDEKSRKFTDQNQSNLTSLLDPVREQLQLFEKKFLEGQNKDIEGRTEIKAEIQQLRKLNEQISLEADSLTKALKGDSKVQGTWGELILEKVFESSGLVKGREYDVQKALKTPDSKSPRPDAIVHLPDGKDIVVDSKVSLTHYERFHAATEESERQEALKKHVISVRAHIRGLSTKNYQQVESIQTLDFVLMFVPIDAALTDALREDPRLFDEALSENIGLVSPASLMLTLRTIEHIWRSDRQNKNALEIASRGGKLYDKFVGFVADLERLGKRIQQTQEAYHGATNKLTNGPGNLIRQAELLKDLGAKTSKSLQSLNQLGYDSSPRELSEVD